VAQILYKKRLWNPAEPVVRPENRPVNKNNNSKVVVAAAAAAAATAAAASSSSSSSSSRRKRRRRRIHLCEVLHQWQKVRS